MLKERPAPSVLQVVVIAGVIFLVIVLVIISMNTGDILWFWPVFSGDAQRVVVHCYGNDVIVEPGDASYEAINSAVKDSLTGKKRWDSLSMSDVTYEEYQTSPVMMVVELGYNPPTRVHSFYKFFKSVDTLVIPLDGRHAAFETVFGRFRDHTLAGSFHVKDTSNIMTILNEQELCQQP